MDNLLEQYWNLVVPDNLADDEYVRILAIKKLTEKQQKAIELGMIDKEDYQITKENYIKTCDELAALVKKYKHNWNLYISLSTVKENSGSANDLIRRQVLFFDFDKKDYPQYKEFQDFTKRIKQRLPLLFNHCAVDSGNGYHFYVAIKPSKDIKRITRTNKKIAAILGADMRAVKTTQIARIPMSLNLKGEEPKPVSVISNSFGTPKFKPYKLAQLERLGDNVSLDRVEYSHGTISEHYCIEKALREGVYKGERNFWLGRITKYLHRRGYDEARALQLVLEWNTRCEPAKSVEEVKADFKAYWENDYKLLGCTMPDEGKQAILSKYCDRHECKAIRYAEFKNELKGEEFLMDNHLLDNKVLRKLKGYHYLIMTVLHIHTEGLTLAQTKKAITGKKSKKPCIDPKTLRKVLSELVSWKYISNTNGLYKLIDIANYGRGYTRFYYSASTILINKIISQQEYLLYLALVKNLQQHKSVSYDELSEFLNMDKGNISRCMYGLMEANMLKIQKVYNDKGMLCNRYTIYA